MEKKIYFKKSQKVIDLLTGFLFIPVLFLISAKFILRRGHFHDVSVYIFIVLAGIAGVIYLCIKRKYIGIGLLFAFVISPLVFLGACWVITGGKGILAYL